MHTCIQMAAPACAASAALVRQYFEEGFHVTGRQNLEASLNPSAALVKAVMINGARPVRSQTTVCIHTYIYVIHTYCLGASLNSSAALVKAVMINSSRPVRSQTSVCIRTYIYIIHTYIYVIHT
jgi:hypothetical protein